MPLFSLIVPVYNGEQTLCRCLASLKNQTEPDFEVLIIENGSTDSSAAICASYAAEDSRFQVLQLETSCGPSAARNAGLDRAQGKWTAFVDSDDHVESTYLACLRTAFEAEDPDAVFFGYHRESFDGQHLDSHIPEIPADLPLPKQLAALSNQGLFGYTWVKAFRREAIGRTRFPQDLDLLEDEVFACQVLKNARHIVIVPQALYHYVTGNSASLIHKIHPDYPQRVDRVFRGWVALLDGLDAAPEFLAEKANAAAANCMYYCFERDVPLRSFVDTLAETGFFAAHTQWSPFDQMVQQRQYRLLRLAKWKYNLKQALSRKLRRKELEPWKRKK